MNSRRLIVAFPGTDVILKAYARGLEAAVDVRCTAALGGS